MRIERLSSPGHCEDRPLIEIFLLVLALAGIGLLTGAVRFWRARQASSIASALASSSCLVCICFSW